MLALVDGTPKILNLKEFIYYYLEHQKDIITRRTRYDLAKTEVRAHILQGLVIAQASIEEVVEVCRSATDKTDCVQKLTSRFELDTEQATAVAELRLYRLSHLEVDKLNEELAELEAAIADYKDILAHEQRVLDIIKTDLIEIKKKYPSERKTEIAVDFGDIEDADLIPVEQVVISLTHTGYAKRLPVAEYKAQHRGGMGITGHKPKEEDFVESMFVCSTHDDILMFSSLGKVYSVKGYNIPEAARASRGRALVNIVQIAQDEKINALIPIKANAQGYIAFATKNGQIKKTKVEEFEHINKNGKIAIKLNDGDELISVQFTTGNDQLMIASSGGKCIRFSEDDVRSMGRDTAGVKAMNLGNGECLVDMIVVDESKSVLTVTANGFGKRSDIADYRLQGRAGKGIKAGTFNAVTGKLINLKQVTDDDDIMIISESGTLIRMHCSDISTIGRAAKGVHLMRLKDGAVATVAVTERDDEVETQAPDETIADLSPEEIAGDDLSNDTLADDLSNDVETKSDDDDNNDDI
jgi:DNA gyrase subunit A